METSRNCRFCDIVAGKYYYNAIDKPFINNDSFIAVASIGAMVEGWSLIIPKNHQLSMKSVYGSSSFKSIMTSVIPKISSQYGTLIAFEHGANYDGSITSCGTDHAHLHLVPWKNSLLPELHNSKFNWVQARASEIKLKSGLNEYLFYTELKNQKYWHDPIGYLHILEKPVSQFFRRLIANQCGRTEEVNYNSFPLLDIALQTRDTLAMSID